MKRALHVAQKALLLNKIPIGAILVYNNFELGLGFNFSKFHHCFFCHAEVMSLKQGCFYNSNYLLNNIVLYITLEPCSNCMFFIFSSNVTRIVFAAYSKKKSLFFLDSICCKKNSVTGGVLENKSIFLLKKFFSKNRFNSMNCF